MAKKKSLTTDEWVERLNVLGRKMDSETVDMHPSAWPEWIRHRGFLGEWEALVSTPTYDPPEQLALPFK